MGGFDTDFVRSDSLPECFFGLGLPPIFCGKYLLGVPDRPPDFPGFPDFPDLPLRVPIAKKARAPFDIKKSA